MATQHLMFLVLYINDSERVANIEYWAVINNNVEFS